MLSIFVTWVLSLLLLISLFTTEHPTPVHEIWFTWLGPLGDGYLSSGQWAVVFGSIIDPLTIIMVAVVSSVSLLVQVYSLSYMKGDKSYAKYFIYMSLFTASMLGLVVSRNLVQIFIFWELVGVSSYLLIGFWGERPAAAAAAKKAFLMTRIGDFGFLLALMYLASLGEGGHLLDVTNLYAALQAGELTSLAATLLALGFFAGAVGKSAQFPLHTWLPDAMEGPTSVSALIHSATMVAAGVFLVARLFPLFLASDILPLVAIIGVVTAGLAATMALTSNDIKRVMAFSTISQLGYMMFALGIGAYAAALFHLFTHAFFKAGLFLSAGSVHHASGTFNMRYMGGLRKVMPLTYLGIVICGLSLAAVFPLSGFWSKDEILVAGLEMGGFTGILVLVAGLAISILTAFYMFRAIFITFHGKYRGGAEKELEGSAALGLEPPDGLGHTHLAESPRLMVVPIVLLSVLAIGAGVLINPPSLHFFSSAIVEGNQNFSDSAANYFLFPLGIWSDFGGTAVFPNHDAAIAAGAEPHFNFPIAIASSVLALAGIAIAAWLYGRGTITALTRFKILTPAAHIFSRRYFLDELYEGIVVKRAFYKVFGGAVSWADMHVFDNTNIQLSLLTRWIGGRVAHLQNGQTQTYAVSMVIGVGIMVIVAYIVLSASS